MIGKQLRSISWMMLPLLSFCYPCAASAQPGQPKSAVRAIATDSSEIEYAGYVRKGPLLQPGNSTIKLMRLERILDMPGTGYRWDNPGAIIRFRTNASEIEAAFYYNDLHKSKTARNSIGVYSVDNAFKPDWSFKTRQEGISRAPETVVVTLAKGGVAVFHNYEIFLPYGDSVDFAGLRVNQGAQFKPFQPKPLVRYVAYGDSITQGFAASAVDKTYPFLVAENKGWEAINLGLARRDSRPSPTDTKIITSLKPDILTVLMGGNDWQGGVPLEEYRTDITAFLANIRAAQPRLQIYLLTPLWVPETWKPKSRIADLESYRQILRDIVASRKDPDLHIIEGPALIDHTPMLFDQIAVHPTDAGFAMMAQRLEEMLKDPRQKQ